MLVLSRKAGERIHIGDDVVITLTKIAGNRAAIGIEAPREVSILRGELVDADADSDRSPGVLSMQRDFQRGASSGSNYVGAAQ